MSSANTLCLAFEREQTTRSTSVCTVLYLEQLKSIANIDQLLRSTRGAQYVIVFNCIALLVENSRGMKNHLYYLRFYQHKQKQK